jgi:Tfp pilus assembly protein PilO
MAGMSEKKILVTVVAGSLALTGLCGGGLYWTDTKVEEERAEISRINESIRVAQAKIARIPKDEREVIILRENLQEYVKILPEEKELENFTRVVNQFAVASPVVLKSMTPAGDGKSKEAFERVTYKLQLEGTIWQFMRFVNHFESYRRFISVTNYDITAGAKNPKDSNDQDLVHQIRMDVDTYVYHTAAGGSTPVVIPGYDKKKEQYREDIHKAKADIVIDKYIFKEAKSRRDIFVDPRIDKVEVSGAETGLPLNEQKALIERARADIALLEEKWKVMEAEANFIKRFEHHKAFKDGMAKVEAHVADVKEKVMLTYRPHQLRFQIEVVQRLEALKRRHAEAGSRPDVGMPLADMQLLRTAMEEHLDSGEMEQAVERYESVKDKIVTPDDDPRHALAQQIGRLYQKAKVGLEFSRKTIQISGAVVVESGYSGAIINGKTYQEGDALEDDLFIKAIGRESVEFLFKGVIISKKR